MQDAGHHDIASYTEIEMFKQLKRASTRFKNVYLRIYADARQRTRQHLYLSPHWLTGQPILYAGATPRI